ncbi:C-GCAxxG-C-C family protein [Vibrio quintilis]|uniref:Putative redox-active protein (C_GCAxxG_C_C) n=1 Tax=Vibrio quintilis TaxID=1117707 RepID=A0A1M7YVR3_9VIBR|nr:C-GCAxxG-C-C family protein [Vibrio quintilis]SHO56653.1 Putative redox-active protein (C_GCAxxG_C_C) [Vibrio quintilis]
MKLQQLIEQGFQARHDLNCAETIVKGANDTYGLGLDDNAIRLAAGFGGGMCVEGACGVVTGITMVLSALYAKERGHTSPEMKEKIKLAIQQFESLYQSTNCHNLKENHRDEKTGCHGLILSGGEILDEIVGAR